jgi:hypothetical protein
VGTGTADGGRLTRDVAYLDLEHPARIMPRCRA